MNKTIEKANELLEKISDFPWEKNGEYGVQILDKHDEWVCQLWDRTEDNMLNHENNAQFIAQAPELIQALIEEVEKYQWISVDGANNLPEGDWLVLCKDAKKHVAKKKGKLVTIGNYFDFDMSPVISYMPLPETPDE